MKKYQHRTYAINMPEMLIFKRLLDDILWWCIILMTTISIVFAMAFYILLDATKLILRV